jgi:hypothetical protein
MVRRIRFGQRIFAVALVLACLGAVADALAAVSIYMCVDASGRTITADRPPPECADRQIRELRPDGSVRRVIEAPATPDQRARRAAEERQRKQQEEEMRNQRRRDRALLAAYPGERDIDRAEQEALDRQRAALARAEARIQSLRDERKRLDDEAEFYKGRKPPQKLQAAFEANATMMKAQEQIVADNAAEVKRIEQRFEVERRQYREATQRNVPAM